MIYQWREILSVPEEPGVYAWYYAPELTDFDLERVIALVEQRKAANDAPGAAAAVRELLDGCLFRYFREEPYEVLLRGPLKPRYRGSVSHQPRMSGDLVDRLVQAPDRLRTIKRVLENSAPHFASPLYIGMSERLRGRLARHKTLIERYGASPLGLFRSESTSTITQEQEQRDHSFAREIRARGIPPTRLFVLVHVIDASAGEYVDIENILNRIHYPLLGRN